MANRRFGWHSGVVDCWDVNVANDLTILGDLQFGDVSVDTFTVTGNMVVSGSPAIGIDMSGTFSTAALRMSSTVTASSFTGLSIAPTVTGQSSGTLYGYTVDFDYSGGDVNCYGGLIDIQQTGETSGSPAIGSRGNIQAFRSNARVANTIDDAYAVRGSVYVLPAATEEVNDCVGVFATLQHTGTIERGATTSALCAMKADVSNSSSGTWEGQIFNLFMGYGSNVNAGDTTAIIYGYTHADARCDYGMMLNNYSPYMTAGIYLTETSGATPAMTTAISIDANCTTGLLIATTAVTTAVSITAGSMTDAIKISGTTPVDGLEISSACSAAAINLTGANADGILIAGANTTAAMSITGAEVDGIVISTSTPVIGISITSLCETGISIAASSTMGLAVAVAAGVGGIAIDAGTVNHAADGSIVDINLDIQGAYSVNAINVNLDFETTGMGAADVTTAFNADINELVAHTDAAGLYGTNVTLTGFATGECDLIGHLVTLDGTKTTDETVTGFKTVSTATIAHSGADQYGLWVDFSGMTHTDGNVYGIYTDVSMVNNSAAYGLYVAMGTDATAGVSINGISLIGLEIAAVCPTGISMSGVTGYAIDIATAGVIRMGVQDTGVPLTSTYPFAVDIQCEANSDIVPGGTGSSAGVYARYAIEFDQTTQCNHIAMFGKLRVKQDLADGNHVGMYGLVEISGTTEIGGTATTQTSAGFFAIDAAAGLNLSTGYMNGILIDSSIATGATTTGVTAAARVKVSSSCDAWDYGLVLEDSSTLIGIQIGTCAQILVAGSSGTPITTALTTGVKIIDINTETTGASGSTRGLYLNHKADGAGSASGEAIRGRLLCSAAVGSMTGVSGGFEFDSGGAISGSATGMTGSMVLNSGGQSTGGLYGVSACMHFLGTGGVPTHHAILEIRAAGNATGADKCLNAISFCSTGTNSGSSGYMIYDQDSTGASESNGSIRILVDEGSGKVAKYLRYWDSENA